MKKFLFSFVIALMIAGNACAQSPTWKYLSNFPTVPANGSFDKVVSILPYRGDTVFAIAEGGRGDHIHISTDKGKSWHDTKNNAPFSGPTILTHEGLMLHGANWNIASSFTGGIFLSKDFGKSWITVLPDSLLLVYSIIKGKSEEYFSVIGTSTGLQEYIYHSTDNGVSWNRIYYDNGINGLVYFNDGSLFTMSYDGTEIYRSSDLGNTWTTVLRLTGYGAALLESDGNILYIQTSDRQVFTSTTGLAYSWVQRVNAPFSNNYTSYSILGGTIINNEFISVDTGMTWKEFPNSSGLSPTGGDATAIDSSGAIYVSGGSSILRSEDNGTNFTVSGLSADISGFVPQDIIAPAGKSLWLNVESHHSLDDGASWSLQLPDSLLYIETFGIGTDGSLLAAITDSNSNLLIIRSTDEGISWSYSSAVTQGNSASIVGESAPGRLFLVDQAGNFYHSENNGKSWAMSSTGSGVIGSLSLYVADSLRIYGYDNSSHIFLSSHNGGETWLSHRITNNAMTARFSSKPDGSVIAAFDGTLVRTVNDGDTWDLWNTGIPDDTFVATKVNDLTRDINGTVYAATASGVFAQLANEKTWHAMSTGLPDSNILAITNRQGKALYATTSKNEIYKMDLFASAVHSIAGNPVPDISITPNPASSAATISYSLSHPQYTKIELIDQLGRVLRLLHSAHEDDGQKSISFPVAAYPSGIYYLRLQNDDGMKMQKMIIEK